MRTCRVFAQTVIIDNEPVWSRVKDDINQVMIMKFNAKLTNLNKCQRGQLKIKADPSYIAIHLLVFNF